MTSHPNFDRTQAALNAARQGDYAPAFDTFTDDVLMENGPGAGPWHRARGKDDLALLLLLLLEFTSSLGETFHQDGRCVYADDRVAISLIHETGTAQAATASTTSRSTSTACAQMGKPNGCGPLTLTPSTVKPSGRKTPRRTFPNSGSGAFPRRQIGAFVRQLNRNHADARTNAISGHG